MKKCYKKLSFLMCFCLLSSLVLARDQPLAPADYFDFWLGEWDLHWYHEDGSMSKGYNRIVKILDGKVIQENFESYSEKEEVPLKGMSLSVYTPRAQRWQQSWADNQGGYFSFEGKKEGDKRIFFTTYNKEGGREVILRMVFSNIQENSLLWTWEASEDGGEQWEQMWQIHYERHTPHQ